MLPRSQQIIHQPAHVFGDDCQEAEGGRVRRLAVQDMHIGEVSLRRAHPNVTSQVSTVLVEKIWERTLHAGNSVWLSSVRTSVQRLWLAHVGYCAATYRSSCCWDSCTRSCLTLPSVILGSNMSCSMLTQRLPKVPDAASRPASCLLQNSAARLTAQKSWPHRLRFQARVCAKQTKEHGGTV
jgi:hypothetical protein